MESNDSPEIPDRGEISDIPGLLSGEGRSSSTTITTTTAGTKTRTKKNQQKKEEENLHGLAGGQARGKQTDKHAYSLMQESECHSGGVCLARITGTDKQPRGVIDIPCPAFASIAHRERERKTA